MTEHGTVWLLAVTIIICCVLVMAAGHEHHYKERRYRLLEARLKAVEEILIEDRLT